MSEKLPPWPTTADKIDWDHFEEVFPVQRWNQERMRHEDVGPPPSGARYIPGRYNPETRAEYPGCYIRRRTT